MVTDASSNAGSPSKRAIKAIDATSIHRITSAQVVVDLQTGVKELVENSLDAGANNIEVRFKDYGLTSFEVIDNGTGISENDYETVALNHHTSKLVTFDDLTSVKTFGFRGEALSSLCSLGKVVIQTADGKTSAKGHQLDFDAQGKLISKKIISRQRGTTVQVSQLFSTLPVRAKQFAQDHRKHFAQALTLLQAYALISAGVRLTVSNQVSKKPKANQFQTRGNSSVRQNFSEVFTPKALQSMIELDLRIRVEPDASVLRAAGRWKGKGKAPAAQEGGEDDLATEVKVVGLISKPVHSQGRASGDRQFFYVNGRPFNPSKVAKCFNDVYRSFNPHQYPSVVADFRLPHDAYDVNIEPNKRTVFLHSEGQLVDALRVALESAFDPYRSTFPISQIALIKPTFPTSTSATYPHKAPPSPPPRKRKVPVVKMEDEGEREAEGEEEEGRGEGKRSRLEEMDTDEFFADEAAQISSGEAVGAVVAGGSANGLFAPDIDFEPDPAFGVELEVDQSADEGEDALEQPSHRRAEAGPGTASVPISSSSARPTSPSPSARSSSPAPPLAKVPPPCRSKPTQMTLDTSNASWNLQKIAPRSKTNAKAGTDAERKSGKMMKKGKGAEKGLDRLKRSLRGFASGSQKELVTMEESEEREEEEEAEEEYKDETEVEAEAEDKESSKEDNQDELEEAAPVVSTRQRRRRPSLGLQSLAQNADGAPNDGHRYRSPEVSNSLRRKRSVSVASEKSTSEPDAILIEERRRNLRELAAAPSAAAATSPNLPAVRQSPRGYRDEIQAAQTLGEIPLEISLGAITAKWESLRTAEQGQREPTVLASPTKSVSAEGLEDAGLDRPEAEAEAALARSVEKADFAKMEIVGQFNLGFIIVRKREKVSTSLQSKAKRRQEVGKGEEELEHDDLFIVDQHASDEKYNFEKLQRETKMSNQMLLSARVLDLPAAEELVAIENLGILAANGFGVHVDEEAPVGQRVRLVAHPVSGNTKWDVQDLEELLHLIQEAPPGSIPRPTKTRRHFAMRACRTSVMIGTPLSGPQMRSIVSHMGTMDQPWACPHGRPTMRWLASCGVDAVQQDLRHSIPNLGELIASIEA